MTTDQPAPSAPHPSFDDLRADPLEHTDDMPYTPAMPGQESAADKLEQSDKPPWRSKKWTSFMIVFLVMAYLLNKTIEADMKGASYALIALEGWLATGYLYGVWALDKYGRSVTDITKAVATAAAEAKAKHAP